MVIFSQESLNVSNNSIFLAGPTPRRNDIPSWRDRAVSYLNELRFTGSIISPEYRDGNFERQIVYKEQIEWEEEGLTTAGCILFWIPRNMESMPALTTNDEWGYWKSSGKCVLGFPVFAVHVRYQYYYAKKFNIPTSNSLLETCRNAIKLLERNSECI